MTSTPEQPKPEVEGVPLGDRLERIRTAIIELKLARYSLGLQPYFRDEIEAAYVEARRTTLASRVVLDGLDALDPVGGWISRNVISEHLQKRIEWESDMELENYLRDWVDAVDAQRAIEREE